MPRHLEDTLIGSIYGSRNIDKILIEKAGIYMEISYFDGKNVKGNPARTIGPKTVFHYTSPNNFMSIFKDNKLWFSDCQFMNDKSEYVYIKKVFLKAIKGANIEVNTEKNERFIDYLLPPYNNIRIERQKKGLIVKNCIKIKRYYLLCTSLKRDSHSLWCYYSKNNHYQGYNFGINTEKFINSMRGILPNENIVLPSSISEFEVKNEVTPEIIMTNGSMAVFYVNNYKGWNCKEGDTLTFSFEKYKSETVQKQTFVIGYIRDGIMYEGESMRNIVGSYTLTIKEDGEYNLYIISSTSDYLTIKQGIINHERKKED